MAGVMVTDELYELRKKVDGLEAQLKELKESRDNALDMQDDLQEDIAKRISDAAAKIEQLTQALANGPAEETKAKSAG